MDIVKLNTIVYMINEENCDHEWPT